MADDGVRTTEQKTFIHHLGSIQRWERTTAILKAVSVVSVGDQ